MVTSGVEFGARSRSRPSPLLRLWLLLPWVRAVRHRTECGVRLAQHRPRTAGVLTTWAQNSSGIELWGHVFASILSRIE